MTKGPWWFTVVCLGLYTLIALAIKWTHSPWPLLALIIHPSYNDDKAA